MQEEKPKVNLEKLALIKKELDEMGYDYIDGFISNKKDKVRAIHRKCGNERYTKFSLYGKKGCRLCSRRKTTSSPNGFTKSMSKEVQDKVLDMHNEGSTATEIAKEVGFTASGIRSFLKRQNIKANTTVLNRSRECQVCGKVFTPNNYDGIKKDKYLNCSPECSRISRKNKVRYSKYDRSQIEKVKELKEKAFTNQEIVTMTGVNLNTVKAIVIENDLYLSPDQAQKNSYRKKLEKNSKCMQDMREKHMTYPTNEFNIKIGKIKDQLEKENNRKSIPYLCSKMGMNCNSVRGSMHRRGWSNLIGKQISGPEYEIIEFISSHLDKADIQQSNRKILEGREIDIYIPHLNLGIEFCGLYWHNENSPTPRDKQYHYNKMKQCEKLGIRLITIFEDEWLERKSQVKNYLKSVLGVYKKRVYARKCTVEEVPKDIAKKFLEDNHIQGKTTFKIAFGLYYEDDLLGLVTSNSHHRQGHSDKNVLNRLVFKDGIQVIGGASKLLKYLINYSKKEGYKYLISWSDNRWSQGNIYEKIGFKLEEELNPDYSYYIGGNKRQTKQSNKKKDLIKKGAIGDMSMTESELAKTLNFHRIWDCGKKRWSITL